MLAVIGLGVGPVRAQKVDGAIAIGQSAQVWSETLKEQRRIFIYLPERYAQAKRSYPVLYLLDAEEHFHHATGVVQFLAANRRIPELIVVGITNTERDRDLTPPTHIAKEQNESPRAGGAGRFLKFAAEELAPWVEARYRTAPYRILVGHSLGGLVNVYALLERPKDFQAHIAISPSLWWDGEGYIGRVEREFAKFSTPHFLYLTCGEREKVISTPTGKLADWLKGHPVEGLEFSYQLYKGESHGTTPHRSLYDGLEKLFAGWEPEYDADGPKKPIELAAVEAHFAKVSARFGYKVEPSADAIDAVADSMLERKDFAGALRLLERNVANYPEVASVHESLGKGLEAAGRWDEAMAEYRRALAMTLEGEHPYGDALGDYNRHAEEIAKKRRGEMR